MQRLKPKVRLKPRVHKSQSIEFNNASELVNTFCSEPVEMLSASVIGRCTPLRTDDKVVSTELLIAFKRLSGVGMSTPTAFSAVIPSCTCGGIVNGNRPGEMFRTFLKSDTFPVATLATPEML